MLLLLLVPGALPARSGSVVDTVHNLSVTGPGPIRSESETEVCKFCHIPHNAVEPQPLWGHALSRAEHYETPLMRRRGGATVPAPQPDGSSRLCLSCHDGTVALGDVAGPSVPIRMTQQYLGPGQRGFIGTDLSGSHPISFVLSDHDPGISGDIDMGLKPLSVILRDPAVRLDRQDKMQCTTCHDPHSDEYYQPGRVPHFWMKSTVNEVCLTCHELR